MASGGISDLWSHTARSEECRRRGVFRRTVCRQLHTNSLVHSVYIRDLLCLGVLGFNWNLVVQ